MARIGTPWYPLPDTRTEREFGLSPLGSTDAPLSCLIADRAYDGDTFRAWLAWKGIEVVIPARGRRTNPTVHTSERYKARNIVERSLAQTLAARGYPL